MDVVLFFCILVVIFIIYYIPTILAYHNRHKHLRAIVCLNAFGGLTFLGWIGSLVWSQINVDNNTKQISPKDRKFCITTILLVTALQIFVCVGIYIAIQDYQSRMLKQNTNELIEQSRRMMENADKKIMELQEEQKELQEKREKMIQNMRGRH